MTPRKEGLAVRERKRLEWSRCFVAGSWKKTNSEG